MQTPMMQNNPLFQLVSVARSGGSVPQMLQQMARQNPQAARAYNMIQGKSSAQLQQMAINMCKERGTSPEAVLRNLGL